jgi:hypothetical protein
MRKVMAVLLGKFRVEFLGEFLCSSFKAFFAHRATGSLQRIEAAPRRKVKERRQFCERGNRANARL